MPDSAPDLVSDTVSAAGNEAVSIAPDAGSDPERLNLLIFGGTSEGRKLAFHACELGFTCLITVATPYGEELMEEEDWLAESHASASGHESCEQPLPGSSSRHEGSRTSTDQGNLQVLQKRLNTQEMVELMERVQPALIIDATHPYALEVSASIREACRLSQRTLIRVLRESEELADAREFVTVEQLCAALNENDELVFSTLGVKEAAALSQVRDYGKRIWLRVLPFKDSLEACLAAGFPAKHLICMQGPFGEELNVAMFQHTGAKILLTKDSGSAGGFPEKIAAARRCGMKIYIWKRPLQEEGLSLEQIERLLEARAAQKE